jgi:hypothetical protein
MWESQDKDTQWLTWMSSVPIATSGSSPFMSTEETDGGAKWDGVATRPPDELNDSNVDCWHTANKHFTRMSSASSLLSCNHITPSYT